MDRHADLGGGFPGPDRGGRVDEEFLVTLRNPLGSGRETSLATSDGTGTILNDDRELPGYVFTEIVTPADGPFIDFGNHLAMNEAGTVAFSAARADEGWSVYAGKGGESGLSDCTEIASTSGPFSYFANHVLSINADGTVLFDAQLDTGERGLFTGKGGEHALSDYTAIATTAGPFSSFRCAVSNDEMVVFLATLDTGGAGIFAARGGETELADYVHVADTSSMSGGDLAISSSGNLASKAVLADGQAGIFAWDYDGEGFINHRVIARRVAPFSMFGGVSINDSGRVAFEAILSDVNARYIFTGVRCETTFDDYVRVADSTQGFLVGEKTAITNRNTIFYMANIAEKTFQPGTVIPAMSDGILAGPDPKTDRIAAPDWLLDVMPGALAANNSDQVAFEGTFSDGTEGIFRGEFYAACPSLAIDDVTVVEGLSGTTQAVFTVSLINHPGKTVTVDFATEPYTATVWDTGSDAYRFDRVGWAQWFETPTTTSWQFETNSDSLFTSLVLPTGLGLSGVFELEIAGDVSYYDRAARIEFPDGGVTGFRLTQVDLNDTLGSTPAGNLPVRLEFSQPTASFTIEGITTVDPSPHPGYLFTAIADTSGPFTSFGAPTISASGDVAFLASADDGRMGVFVGSGGEATLGDYTIIADDTGPFQGYRFGGSPSINREGTVAFWVETFPYSQAIVTGAGGGTD